MNKKELEKEIQKLSKFTKRIFKKDGQIYTSFFFSAICNHGKKAHGIIPLPNELFEQRFDILKRAGAEIKNDSHIKEVKAILMISEVFFNSPVKKGQKAIEPSKDPNAKKGIVIAGMNENGEQSMVAFEISKKWWRKATLIKAKQLKNFDKIESPLLAEFWKGYKQVITA